MTPPLCQRINFAHLAVSATIEVIPEEVKADPTAYERIAEERSFEIDVVAPQLVKREIIRPKYRHKTDRSRPLVVAPAPARAVAGGYASAGLLAWVTLSKYVEHQPLYRREQMSERWGCAHLPAVDGRLDHHRSAMVAADLPADAPGTASRRLRASLRSPDPVQ